MHFELQFAKAHLCEGCVIFKFNEFIVLVKALQVACKLIFNYRAILIRNDDE